MRNGMAILALVGALVTMGLRARAGKSSPEALVKLVRAPNGGIQPQAAMDDAGVLHLVYFVGEPAHGDLYYVRSSDGGGTFSAPMKVNSHPGSAIATGNIRGAHLALGRKGRVYVAWNGTWEVDRPGVKQAFMKQPMLLARLNGAGSGFEPELNTIHEAYGLNGGGALAADRAGNVYVFWHAPAPGTEGEGNRRVWVARSQDDGKTFAPETPAFEEPTGACGCCGMSAMADRRGNLYVLYRSARETVHRDIYLLYSHDKGLSFRGTNIARWEIGACTMSMQDLAEGPTGVLAAWETKGNVFYGVIDASSGRMPVPVAMSGEALGRKYPVLAANSRGEILMAWTEGMTWSKGGSVAWQLFDAKGQPKGNMGRAEGVPSWSLIAAFARPDGGFTIIY